MTERDWQMRTFRFGPVAVVATREAVLRVVFGPSATKARAAVENAYPDAVKANTPLLDEAMAQLEAYFSGRCRLFSLPLDDTSLSPFARTVHRELLAVPFGGVISYAELAARAGSPRAARAVGRVMASNPFPLVVPCHRVVNADGRIGHYSGGRGQSSKVALLDFEKGLA